jgi:hypothetical protein
MYLTNAFRSTDCAPISTPEVAPMWPTTDWLPTITAVPALGSGAKSVRTTIPAGDFTATAVPMQVRVRFTQQAAPPRGVFR